MSLESGKGSITLTLTMTLVYLNRPILVLAEHHDSSVGGDPEGWKAVVHVDNDSPHSVQPILMRIRSYNLFM